MRRRRWTARQAAGVRRRRRRARRTGRPRSALAGAPRLVAMSVMVTGGAGYIGAHVVRSLREAGHAVVVVDDLSTGRAERVGDAPLVELDLAAPGARERL